MLTSDDRVGVVLGNTYRLERLIGTGGMGSVYEASHLRVPRRFAVKLLNPEIAMTQAILERFQREAEIAGSLGDEHITQVFDFNRADDGSPYMVLELLEGEDLSQRLARGALSMRDTVELMVQVTGALDRAHAAGVVHRDLKPSNLFLCRSDRGLHVKVMDFGISKVLHQTGSSTRTGMVLGTPNYMSPEQAQGLLHEVDLRSDIFALGTILYECLTGRMAFTGVTPVAAIINVCQSEPVQLTSLAPGVPASIERIVSRALSKRRDDRHASAGELRDDLLRATQAAGMPDQRATIRVELPAGTAPAATPLHGPRAGSPPTTLRSAPGEIVTPPSDARPTRRRGLAWLAGLTLAAAAAAIVVVSMRGDPTVAAAPPILAPPAAPTSAPTSPPTTAAVPPATAPASQKTAAVPPAPAPDSPKPAAPPPATAAVPPATAGPAAALHVRLEVTPADAKVEIDGRPVTDRELDIDPSKELHIIARAPGYQTLRITRHADASGALPIQLARQKASPGARGKKTEALVEDKW